MPFGGFHPVYLVILLIIVLIIFGPGKLPELGGAVGRAMREFRKATTELRDEVTRATEAEPEKPASASSDSSPAAAASTDTSKKTSSKS